MRGEGKRAHAFNGCDVKDGTKASNSWLTGRIRVRKQINSSLYACVFFLFTFCYINNFMVLTMQDTAHTHGNVFHVRNIFSHTPNACHRLFSPISSEPCTHVLVHIILFSAETSRNRYRIPCAQITHASYTSFKRYLDFPHTNRHQIQSPSLALSFFALAFVHRLRIILLRFHKNLYTHLRAYDPFLSLLLFCIHLNVLKLSFSFAHHRIQHK